MFLRRVRILFAYVCIAVIFLLGSGGRDAFGIRTDRGVLDAEDGTQWQDCATHRDDFGELGFRCCPDEVAVKKSPLKRRDNGRYCDEITPEQELFKNDSEASHIKDVLEFYVKRGLKPETQAKCGSRNGFLIGGLPILETPENSVLLRNQYKCAHFGSNLLLAMLEWLGRRITKHFESFANPPRFVIGDLSRPKGGAIRSGHTGRMAHRSHQNGLDADIGFLTPIKNAEWRFHSNFLVGANWWFMRRLAENPFACPTTVYLDRKHIRTLEKWIQTQPSQQPLWNWYKQRLFHEKGHANHFHIRISSEVGACPPADFGPEIDGSPELNEPGYTQALKAKSGSVKRKKENKIRRKNSGKGKKKS